MVDRQEPPIVGMADVTLTDIPRTGRRKMDTESLTFPVAVSKAAMWLLAGMLSGIGVLLTWLCVSTMGLKEQNVILLERSGYALKQYEVVHAELERLTIADSVMRDQLEKVKLAQAEHGWKREP
jgi:hypothetical protein